MGVAIPFPCENGARQQSRRCWSNASVNGATSESDRADPALPATEASAHRGRPVRRPEGDRQPLRTEDAGAVAGDAARPVMLCHRARNPLRSRPRRRAISSSNASVLCAGAEPESPHRIRPPGATLRQVRAPLHRSGRYDRPRGSPKLRVRPSFLQTTPARNPRTECCCQPVVCIIASIVAPAGDRSIARTRACLLLVRTDVCVGTSGFRSSLDRSVGIVAGGVLDRLRPTVFGTAAFLVFDREAVLRSDFGLLIGISCGYGAISPPPRPHHGFQAGGAGLLLREHQVRAQYRSPCARRPVLSG